MSTATAKIRTLVVDDEPVARARMRSLLQDEHDIEIIGEYQSGPEAMSAIEHTSPDLVFLDIQMPQMDGLQLARALGDRMPAVVFVTAYDEYALRAFEVHALDYLLKPFDRDRFERALERVRAQLRYSSPAALNRRLISFLETFRPAQRPQDRLVIRSGGRVFFLKVEEIDWIEGEGNYIRIHVGKTSHLVREKMSDVESRLDDSRFLRIHKSTIVNTEQIKEIQPLFNGAHIVLLRDGTRLTWSRGYRSRLRELTGSEG
jgi:two-component system LytT family response regulator